MFAIQCTDGLTGSKTLVKSAEGDNDLATQTFPTEAEANASLPGWREMAEALEWNCTYDVVAYQPETGANA